MSTLKKGTSRTQKYLVLVLMIVSLCTIYILPYLRYQYFTPLQEAMGLLGSATKYGNLVSVYGIMNVICYLPGGIIADKFDPKKLLVFSMISSGLLGIWMSTWPGYEMLLLIHILWGLTTVLTFWSASVKCVNMLASSDEQGQMFGLLEGGRGLLGIGMNAAWVAVFAFFASRANGNTMGMTVVVAGVSILMILDGIALAFLLPKTDASTATNSSIKDSVKALGKSFTLPITWVLAGLIFTCSAIGASASYYAPYLQGACGMTVVMAATFAVFRGDGSRIISAPLFGTISKKMRRSSFTMVVACVSMTLLSVALRFLSPSPATLWPLMVIMVLIAFFMCGNRAVYWAIIDEGGTSKNMVGSVIGVASIVGFLPDTFINTLFGSYLDNFEFSVAYGKIYNFCIAVCIMGTVCAFLGERIIRKYQAKVAAGGSVKVEAASAE